MIVLNMTRLMAINMIRLMATKMIRLIAIRMTRMIAIAMIRVVVIDARRTIVAKMARAIAIRAFLLIAINDFKLTSLTNQRDRLKLDGLPFQPTVQTRMFQFEDFIWIIKTAHSFTQSMQCYPMLTFRMNRYRLTVSSN